MANKQPTRSGMSTNLGKNAVIIAKAAVRQKPRPSNSTIAKKITNSCK